MIKIAKWAVGAALIAGVITLLAMRGGEQAMTKIEQPVAIDALQK